MLKIDDRYIVRIACLNESCERHHASHRTTPGHAATIVCFTLEEARRIAADWERGTDEFVATVYDPQGVAVARSW